MEAEGKVKGLREERQKSEGSHFLIDPQVSSPFRFQILSPISETWGKTFPGDVLKISQGSQLQNQLAPNPLVTSRERWARQPL